MKKITLSVIALTISAMITGCSTSGEQYQANVYTAGQVNSRQAAKTVKILAVLPARIEVDNTEGKQNAQMIGGVLGAIAGGVLGNKTTNHSGSGTAVGAVAGAGVGAVGGSLVKDKVLVDGVSITYVEDGQTYNSAQVGKTCEFTPGVALVVSSDGAETRLQPNATCPVKS
ncbi:MAG: glycine zipper 2TM domain-containing protein [Tolumonas sp.]|uniref:glycine zipper domain-containing protein n=1 Tax=Tolumonas auensis TaxID=43948 RepID=UPI001B55B53A|nr:glycine zipper domain-containing protein [Tolumonas auensis]MBP7980972.1 glycine zipper 2TM domain-containing protein [Tolumonas sp.]